MKERQKGDKWSTEREVEGRDQNRDGERDRGSGEIIFS
jgi:hypothetical protein